MGPAFARHAHPSSQLRLDVPLWRVSVGRVTPGLGPATIVCHCLLIEAGNSLVLVDTGFGLGDVARPRRLSAFFRNVNRVQLRCRADRAPADRASRAAARRRAPHRPDASRFRPCRRHRGFPERDRACDGCRAARRDLAALAARPATATGRRNGTMPSDGSRYRASGERWFGFECVRDLAGLPPEILMVPLAGHTVGHAGIAIEVRKVGCCTPATPTFTTAKWTRAATAARRCCAPTRS